MTGFLEEKVLYKMNFWSGTGYKLNKEIRVVLEERNMEEAIIQAMIKYPDEISFEKVDDISEEERQEFEEQDDCYVYIDGTRQGMDSPVYVFIEQALIKVEPIEEEE